MTSLLAVPFKVIIASPDSQIAFDATVSERHSDTLTLTQHPVEQGADVTDHAQKEPEALDINGIISNHPILLNVEDDLQPSVQGGSPDNRAQDAYDEFLRLQANASLLFIRTELRDYENMVLTGISVQRDKTTRNILDIGLTLTQFRLATVESVEAPEPIEPVHRGRRQQGRKQTKAAKPEVEEKQTSVLGDITNAVFGAGG